MFWTLSFGNSEFYCFSSKEHCFFYFSGKFSGLDSNYKLGNDSNIYSNKFSLTELLWYLAQGRGSGVNQRCEQTESEHDYFIFPEIFPIFHFPRLQTSDSPKQGITDFPTALTSGHRLTSEKWELILYNSFSVCWFAKRICTRLYAIKCVL